jgi:hypothetical protein
VCCAGGNGNNLLTWGFVGPIILIGRRCCCIHDGGAVLLGHWGHGTLVQEGPPLVFLVDVLLVCIWHWLLVYDAPASPVSALTVKKHYRGDKSHASLVLIACWSPAHLATSPSLPVMVLSTSRAGDLVVAIPGLLRPVVASVSGVPSDSSASQGNAGVEVVGASPQSGDDSRSLLWGLVAPGVGAASPRAVLPETP